MPGFSDGWGLDTRVSGRSNPAFSNPLEYVVLGFSSLCYLKGNSLCAIETNKTLFLTFLNLNPELSINLPVSKWLFKQSPGVFILKHRVVFLMADDAISSAGTWVLDLPWSILNSPLCCNPLKAILSSQASIKFAQQLVLPRVWYIS